MNLAEVVKRLRELLPRPPRAPLVESHFGVAVDDPFRPLENRDAPEVKAWARAQSDLTREALEAEPAFKETLDFLRANHGPEHSALPLWFGSYGFWYEYDLARRRDVLRVRHEDEEDGRVLVDPADFSDGANVSIASWAASPNGTHVAVALMRNGSDIQETRIVVVADGSVAPDRLARGRFVQLCWESDDVLLHGFYRDGEGEGAGQSFLFRHRLGQAAPSDPPLIQARGVDLLSLHPLTPIEALGVTLAKGLDCRKGFQLQIDDGSFLEILRPGVGVFRPFALIVGENGPRLYAVTDIGAPRGRVVAIDLGDPEPDHWHCITDGPLTRLKLGPAPDIDDWETVIEEDEPVLEDARYASDRIFVCYNRGAHHDLWVYNMWGGPEYDIELPPYPRIVFDSPGRYHADLYFHVATYTEPFRMFRYQVESETLDVVFEPGAPGVYALPRMTVDETLAESADGTRVPLAIVRRADAVPNGEALVCLSAYGGFGSIGAPVFSWEIMDWVRRGGVFVRAHVRGGGELGADWREAARGRGRQKSLDDFIAAAEHLIKLNWTRPAKLGVSGASHGGLLVCACMLQRPDLFGAVVAQAPLTDMVGFKRIDKLGPMWTEEYGDPAREADFAALIKYSPFHNVESGRKYPPALIMAGESDDRLSPSHAYKFVAALQERTRGVALLHVMEKAGHWRGDDYERMNQNTALEHAFLMAVLQGGFAANDDDAVSGKAVAAERSKP